MKKFLKYVAIFGTPILILAIALEVVVRTVPNDYSYKKNYLDKHASELEILIFGSSHGLYCVNPAFFNKYTFNTSQEYQSLKYDKFIFDKYKDRFKSLKYIVLPISYFSLFYELEEAEGNYRIKNYCMYYNCEYHRLSVKNNVEILNGRSMLHLQLAKRYLLENGNDLHCRPDGYGMMYQNTPSYDVDKTGPIAAARQSSYNIENLGPNLQRLNAMIEDCAKRNIKVYLFTPPSWPAYVKNLEPRRLKILADEMDKIVKKYPNVTYRSFMEDSSFVRSDYRDSYHVNEIGAEKLSKMINKDLGL
jgi:hypothetical protein